MLWIALEKKMRQLAIIYVPVIGRALDCRQRLGRRCRVGWRIRVGSCLRLSLG